jgi:CRISPR-associated protein Cas2
MEGVMKQQRRGFSEYAVVYDISEDKERDRVDQLLKGFGQRVQKSVFECTLTRNDKEELLRKLQRLELKTGFVKVYRLEFTSKPAVIGKEKNDGIDKGNAYII